MQDPSACDALLTALKKEILDDRTWETQYQLIMALSETRCKEALPLILQLAKQNFWATMRQVAVGDAFVRLSISSLSDSQPIFDAIAIANQYDIQIAMGAMRAAADLRLIPSDEAITSLLSKVADLGNNNVDYWSAVACTGWKGRAVEVFLNRCSASKSHGVRDAAALALTGTFVKLTYL